METEANNGQPALVAAVAAVMADLNTLAWDSKNEHVNYRYASIDAFLAALRPKMAAHGLLLAQDLESSEVSDGLLRMHWSFTLHHSGGGTLGPLRLETGASAKMGPQAYGGAQAYALKFMLRSLFLIACDEATECIDQRKDERLPDRAKQKPKRAQAPAMSMDDLDPALRLSSDEAASIREWLDATATDEAAFLEWANKRAHQMGYSHTIETVEDMVPVQYPEAVAMFEKKARQGAAA